MTESGFWPFKDGNTWKWCVVGGPITWELGKPGSGFTLTIPEGFVSDFVTIPNWFKPFIDENAPQTARAAVVHDALLAQGFEQRVAAGEFYRVLRDDGVEVREAQRYYAAVLVASDNWEDVGALSHG